MSNVIAPQPGPQTFACKTPANIIFYGGQAGGGKSYWLLLKFCMLAILYPGFQGIIFRRTRPELVGAGSLWLKSWEVFQPAGFTPREGNILDWRHPNGSLVEFDHLQHEKDIYKHQGPSYHAVGFDEACHFLESQFWYLISRLRDGPKHRDEDKYMTPVMCCTMNPDPDSFIKTMISWWLDSNKQFADPSKSGKIRWLLRRGDDLLWADKPEDLPCDEDDKPKAVTFIPSKLSDNKILCERDPGYRANLRLQLPHVRAQLEQGDWSVSVKAGDYFQRGWFKPWATSELERRVLGQPSIKDLVVTCRAYDLAATPVKGDTVPGVERPEGFTAQDAGERNPDWTRGVKLGRFRNGDMLVMDMVSCRDTPGGVDALIERTAIEDGPQTVIHIPQDPGQAGVDQIDNKKRRLRKFARVVSRVRQKSKEHYAKDCSTFCFSGRVWYVNGSYIVDFFREIEKFPPENKDVHDDVVDAFVDAFDWLVANKYEFGYTKVPDSTSVIEESNDIRANAGFRRGELL